MTTTIIIAKQVNRLSKQYGYEYQLSDIIRDLKNGPVRVMMYVDWLSDKLDKGSTIADKINNLINAGYQF